MSPSNTNLRRNRQDKLDLICKPYYMNAFLASVVCFTGHSVSLGHLHTSNSGTKFIDYMEIKFEVLEPDAKTNYVVDFLLQTLVSSRLNLTFITHYKYVVNIPLIDYTG